MVFVRVVYYTLYN